MIFDDVVHTDLSVVHTFPIDLWDIRDNIKIKVYEFR